MRACEPGIGNIRGKLAGVAADSRFANSPLVVGESRIRFCAAVPLVTDSGRVFGILCVFDREPRGLRVRQRAALEALARQAAKLTLRSIHGALQQTLAAARNDQAELEQYQAELRRLAETIRETARGAGAVARYGGEEFVAVLPAANVAGALALAERIRGQVEKTEWSQHNLTISVGVVTRGIRASVRSACSKMPIRRCIERRVSAETASPRPDRVADPRLAQSIRSHSRAHRLTVRDPHAACRSSAALRRRRPLQSRLKRLTRS